MAHVAEHHPEEERERNDCKYSRISLKVLGNTIRVYNLLVDVSEFVCLYVSRRGDSVVFVGRDTHSVETLESLRDVVLLVNWCPEVAGESLSLPLHHVQSLVQNFFLCKEHLVDVDS